MTKIIALGANEFTLGFRLAGIEVVPLHAAEEDFTQLFQNPDIGIIITDEATMEQLSPFFREIVEGKVKPVTVVVSPTASNETLRKKIKKAIGVDLWNQ